MSRLCLYYKSEPERDRWIAGDRFVRPLVRKIVRGKPRPGGIDKVFINLLQGLDLIGIPYEINLPFKKLRSDDRVAVLGRGRHCLDGYDCPNAIVAGIGLMTHPSEWPTLCQDFPVVRYLQHSEWCDRVYRPYFGDRCALWPVGIDTARWTPARADQKCVDFLIYDKIHWEYAAREQDLLTPIRDLLSSGGFTHESIRYGSYTPEMYQSALQRSRAMIFLSAHESQGIAYQEALSANVPIFAWDPGFVQDPNRFRWGQPEIAATSVPYFDERCGRRFKNFEEFQKLISDFHERHRAGSFSPRNYILETLTLEKCAHHFVKLIAEAQFSNA